MKIIDVFKVTPIDGIGKEIKHTDTDNRNHDFNVQPIDDIGKEIKNDEIDNRTRYFKVEVLDVLVKGEKCGLF